VGFRGESCACCKETIFSSRTRAEPWKSQARKLVSQNAASLDRLFTHSRYYAELWQPCLNLPRDRFSHHSSHDRRGFGAHESWSCHAEAKPIDIDGRKRDATLFDARPWLLRSFVLKKERFHFWTCR